MTGILENEFVVKTLTGTHISYLTPHGLSGRPWAPDLIQFKNKELNLPDLEEPSGIQQCFINRGQSIMFCVGPSPLYYNETTFGTASSNSVSHFPKKIILCKIGSFLGIKTH